jgi:membrane protein required for colicin V production
MVDNSRTAKIFARTQDKIDQQIPSDAPGWIVARYEALVSTCTPPTGSASAGTSTTTGTN